MPSSKNLYSVGDLHKSKDATDLIHSSNLVIQYYSERNEKMELCKNFLQSKQWNADELEELDNKGKAAIVFNRLKPSERTYVGSFIQQRYDMKPAPFEPGDQDLSDVITHLYHWTAHANDVTYKDPNLIRSSWLYGGVWQESWIDIQPGRKPVIHVENQNNFNIFPDPNSKDLVNRSDCEFIDRVSWKTITGLCDAIPEKAKEIKKRLQDEHNQGDYVKEDISHISSLNFRNGKFKVIERFYRVYKRFWYGYSKDKGERLDIGFDKEDLLDDFRQDNPGYDTAYDRDEVLYLAVICPSFGNEFLLNEEYHCQPQDPRTGRIMFPLYELVDEEVDGEPQGHAEHQIGPNRIVNSMMANKLYSAKHSAAQSHTVDYEAFDPDTHKDIEENLSDGAKVFRKKPGAGPGPGINVVPQGKFSSDGQESIEFAINQGDEVSSTPPAMRGLSEGNVAGILNEQRIQQSSIQSQVQVTNFRRFLTTRAKLWYYYWREYWTFEDVVRVLEKKDQKDPDFVNINQPVQDEWGGVRKLNDLSAAVYDIVFEDSWQSPTVRDKVRKQIIELQQSAAVQQDPVLNTFLTMYFLKLSDAPQDLKDFVKEHSSVIKQQQQQAQQAAMQSQQLEQAGQVQNLADREAQALQPQSSPQTAEAQPVGAF
jgi:hypothetical protein